MGEILENFEELKVYLEIDNIFLLLVTILKLIIEVLFRFYYLDYFNSMRSYEFFN